MDMTPEFNRVRDEEAYELRQLGKQTSPKVQQELYGLYFDKVLQKKQMVKDRAASREDDLAKLKNKIRREDRPQARYLPPWVQEGRLSEARVTELAKRSLEASHREADSQLEQSYRNQYRQVLAREGIWPGQHIQEPQQQASLTRNFNSRNHGQGRSRER